MREFVELLKKLWDNRRTRAIAILLIYVLFFIIIFSFLNGDKSAKPQSRFLPNSTIEKIKASDNVDTSIFNITK